MTRVRETATRTKNEIACVAFSFVETIFGLDGGCLEICFNIGVEHPQLGSRITKLDKIGAVPSLTGSLNPIEISDWVSVEK